MDKMDVLSAGTVLHDCYEIEECICRTRFSAVYRVYDKYLDKIFAVKEYFPGDRCLRDKDGITVAPYLGEAGRLYADGLKAFIDDTADAMKIKDCSNLVKIYNIFEENNTAYSVMEYVEGKTLGEILKKEIYTYPKAMALMRPVMKALSLLHADGLVHRNVAPDNIIIRPDGQPVLIDSGSYHYVASDSEESMTTINRDAYSPMEQYMKKGTQGPYTDVYSCAALIYRMITGTEIPFAAASGGTAYLKKPEKTAKGIDGDSSAAIINALHSNYKERTQTIDDFLAQLDGTVRVNAKYEKTMSWKHTGNNIWVTGVIVVCVVIVAILAAVTISDTTRNGKHGNREYMLGSGMTIVPNVVNQQIGDALTITRKHLLYMMITDKEYSAEVEKGAVLSQNETPGRKVKAGNYLEIVYCAGVRQIYAENVIGMPKDEAEKLLKSLGFKVKFEDVKSMAKPGYVATQSIRPEEAAAQGSVIVLGISKGRDDIDENMMTTVPQLTGITLEEAERLCEDAKLYYIIVKHVNYAENPDRIYSQSLQSGSEVNEGTVIELVYNDGPKMNRVPDYQYKNISDVDSITGNLKLEIEYVYENSTTVAKDRIIRQSTPAGTLVNDGAHITLWVSLGVADVDVDNIIDRLTTADVTSSTKKPASGNNSGQKPQTKTTENADGSSAQTATHKTTDSSQAEPEQTTQIQYDDDTTEQKWEFDYVIGDDGVTIKSIKVRKYWEAVFEKEEISIPSTIDGHKVVAVEGLSTNAQYGDNIKIINIPSTVKTINTNNLEGRSSLTKIVVDAQNEVYASYDGALYNKARTVLYFVPRAIKEVTLASSLKKIDDSAFRDCRYITRVTIPAAMTKFDNIQGGLFYGCTNLNTINVESGNKRLFSDNGVLYEHAHLNNGPGINFFDPDTWEYYNTKSRLIMIPYAKTSLVIRADCNYVESYSCYYNSLKQITVESGNSYVTVYDSVVYMEFGSEWDIQCFPGGKSEVNLMDGITSVTGELYGSDALVKIVIPDSVTAIDNYKLRTSPVLRSINIPAGVTSIGTGVLENAPNVTATVVKGTYGEEWCKNNNIKYIYG